MSKWTGFRDKCPVGISFWWFATFIDRGLNLVIHGTFRHTLSAYLGATKPDCKLCKWLNKIEVDHCRKAARKEGLL